MLDLDDVLLQERKNQFERQCIAQESKKLALASLLRRLAIGSDNTEKFDQKLKNTLQKQKQKEALPVIAGDIGEPSGMKWNFFRLFFSSLLNLAEKLQISIHMEEMNVNQWANNSDGIQEKFGDALCEAFRIPLGNIRVVGVEADQANIRACVLPPYGKDVIDGLDGTAEDSPMRIKAVRECCVVFKGKIESIRLGDFGLSIDHKLMDSTWNKKYLWSKSEGDEGEYWEKSIDRGGKPYFCPSGLYTDSVFISW